MLIVLTAIAALGLIAGIIMYNKMYDETAGMVVIGISALFLVVCIIVLFVCGGMLIEGRYIPAKIETYEDARADVDVRLEAILNDKQAAVNNDSLIVDANQLNKTDLMKSYMEFTQKITDLKNDLIGLNVVRWWMYFGG